MIAILYDFNNNPITLKNILNFNFSSALFKPENQLEINFNIHQNPSIKNLLFSKIKLIYNNYLIFTGYIENQAVTKSEKGTALSIFASSIGKILTSTTAHQQMYQNISLKDILLKHVAPYGFTFNDIENSLLASFLPNFTVLPGMNEWLVLKTFSLQTLGLEPYMNNENSISLSNSFSNSEITISNFKISANNLISPDFNYISISTKNISSTFFKPVNQPKKNTFSILLSLPNIVPIRTGQTIRIYDDILPNTYINKQFIVYNLYYKFKNDSVITELDIRY